MEALKTFRVYGTAQAVPMMRQRGHSYEVDESGNLHFYMTKAEKSLRVASYANLQWWAVKEDIEEE